jgi:hypothetical protein
MPGLSLIVWQPLRKESERFPGPHRVDHHAKGVRRQHMVEARRDQAGRVAPALQERPQILLAPHIVDDKEAASLGQCIGELGAGGADGLQARALTGQAQDEVGNAREQIVRLLADLDVENAVDIGFLDVGVVAKIVRQRRLPEPAGTPERDGRRHPSPLSSSNCALRAASSSGRSTKLFGGSGAMNGTRF